MLFRSGWQFLHLTDGYSKWDTVQDAFPRFTSRVEKLHMALVLDLLRLENKNKNTSSETKAESSSVGQPSSTQSLYGRNFLDAASNDSSQIDGEHKKSLAESLQTFTSYLQEQHKDPEGEQTKKQEE